MSSPAARMSGNNPAVGAPRPHESARLHVCGEARYIDDLPEPSGLLHLQFGLSGSAHGRIKNLDLAKVRNALGVVAVFTAADIPGVNDVSPVKGDDPLFAGELVEYIGQPLFAVAAKTRLAARKAARLAQVEIDELPAVITIDEALAAKSDLGPPYEMRRGDAAAAIDRAPHRLEGSLEIGGQEHFYLESQAALALPGEGDEITVHSSSQHPSEVQHKVAQVLGLANHQVVVQVRRMGGAFGGKESQGNHPACAAALAARLLGRPVKLVYDRDDDMMITGKRHEFRVRYSVGFDETGRILGLDLQHWFRCGMSWDLSEPIGDRAMFHADNCYYLDNVRIRSQALKTNTQSNTAFRGFGGPQGMLGMERIVDQIAHELRLDPLSVRRRNYYASKASEGDARKTTPYHMLVEDCIIGEMTSELAASADYSRRRDDILAWNEKQSWLKRGIALTPVKFGISFTKTFLNQAGALVHVYSDGSIMLNHGGTEMGQGLNTKVAQVVASAFGVGLDRVKITATATDKVPNTSATAASSGSDLNGMAALDACNRIIERLRAFLSGELSCAAEALRFEAGQIIAGDRVLSFEEAVSRAYMARISLSATGFYATPKIGWDREAGRGRPFYYFAYGAAVCEAIVDVLTGEYKLLRTDILHDVGRSLNPAIDLGQIEGGFVQGVGWLTTEELVWNEKGRLTTHAPSTYKIPTASDRPRQLNISLFESGGNQEETVYRSKAVGEPPLMLANSAFFAISDAIAAVGDYRFYPELDTPATPERVLMAIERIKSLSAEAAA